MPLKKKTKKCKEDCGKVKRNLKLEALIEEFDEQVGESINEMLFEEQAACHQVKERYILELKGIARKFHHMTLEQICELQNKTPPVSSSKYASVINSCRLKMQSLTEQRNLSIKQKKNMTLAKKSQINKITTTTSMSRNVFSGSNCGPPNRKALATVQQTATCSASSNAYRKGATPMGKKRLVHPQKKLINPRQAAVTPKFNPRAPLPSTLLRRPKVGEVIMSLSGSPLQNPVPTNPKKPSFLISLGNGKVLNMAETSNMSSLDALKLDQKTKDTLMDVQRKLAGLLRA